MNDAPAAEEDEAETGPLAGERLGLARRELDIPIAEIAKALHLDDQKVVALEANQFDVVGPPVFAKGHMRKYAELVGVPVDDLLADYYKLQRAIDAPPVVGPKRSHARDVSPGPWIAGVVLLALLSSMAWWWLRPDPNQPVDPLPVIEPDTSAPAVPQQEEAQQPVAQTASEDVPGQETLQQGQAAAATAKRMDNNDAAPVNSVQLRMTFSGDCWTEVSDANGEKLFFDLGRAGRVVTLAGEAPLRLLLGNGENIRITVDGTEVAIPRSNRPDNTVRLTINSQ